MYIYMLHSAGLEVRSHVMEVEVAKSIPFNSAPQILSGK